MLHVFGAILILQSSCGSGRQIGTQPHTDEDGNVAIQVGTKTVVTTKFTKDGTPVVPMWRNPLATLDLRQGAGFPMLEETEHATVWQPASREDGAYNHYACLVYYKGCFYAMWGNHTLAEDAPGQRVLYAKSDSWGQWTEANELFPAPGPVLPRGEKGIHLKPDRWAVIDDKLYAITYVHGAGIYPIAREVHEDGTLGACFLVKDLPSGAALPTFMENLEDLGQKHEISDKIVGWYHDNGQISWWARTDQGIPSKGVDGADLIESFTYRAADGVLVLMLRDWGTSRNPVHSNRMYVSFNDGTGTWGKPYPTDIPDSPSRAQAVTLDDGTVLLIGNQNVPHYDQALYLDRDPMTVSVSNDGYTFDRVYVLRTGSPTGYRFPGVRGRNPGYAYSSTVIHDGSLYTLYSIGKESMEITRVPLRALGID